MVNPLRLSDIATAAGAIRLQKALGSTDAEAAKSLIYARKYLKDNPELNKLRVGVAPTSFFDHNSSRIGLSSSSPDVFAHELGHAAALGLDQGIYKNLVTPRSKDLNDILDRTALLGGTAASAALDREVASTYLNYASALAAATAAPTLYNEAIATHLAASKSGNYLKTVSKLSPGLVSHALDVLSPVAKLQAIKYIKDLPPDKRYIATAVLKS
jgi:hypothetical protein